MTPQPSASASDAPPEEAVFLDRPIIVTGSPRSGKSLVAHLLTASDEFVVIREPLSIWNAGLGARSSDVRTADEATPELRDEIRRACAGAVSAAQKRRYIDDLAHHTLRIGFAHAIMPEAKFILVVRDPMETVPEMMYGWIHRDTIAKAFTRRRKSIRLRSAPRLVARFALNYAASRFAGRRMSWGPRPPGLAGRAAKRSVAETAALQWRELVARALDGASELPDHSSILVRHDDLLTDPAHVAGRIASFCQAERPERIIKKAQAVIDPEYLFEKRIEPTERESAMIRTLVEPIWTRVRSWVNESGSARAM